MSESQGAILLIEPTGAVSINPNLTAIIDSLCSDSFAVDVISTKRDFPQQAEHRDARLILCEKWSFAANLAQYEKLRPHYDLVIGIDQGIIAAAVIAKRLGVPLGLISYEIRFDDEVGAAQKAQEVDACAGVAFAIAQDHTRAYLLSREYRIPLHKILRIPVADGLRSPIPRSDDLRRHFQIPADTRVAIFAGKVTARSMISDLIEAAQHWRGWALVLHSPSGFSKVDRKRWTGARSISNVYFSDLQLNTVAELQRIVASADVGIGFFTPVANDSYEGKNVLFMGLSSGKISMYLKSGLPILINEIGEMSELVRQHRLGGVVPWVRELDPDHYPDLTHPGARQRSEQFFAARLSFDLFEPEFRFVVREALDGVQRRPYNEVGPPSLPADLAYIDRQTREFNSQRFGAFPAASLSDRFKRTASSLIPAITRKAKSIVKRHILQRESSFIVQFNTDLIRFFDARVIVRTPDVPFTG